jgi:hypothetical protein
MRDAQAAHRAYASGGWGGLQEAVMATVKPYFG